MGYARCCYVNGDSHLYNYIANPPVSALLRMYLFACVIMRFLFNRKLADVHRCSACLEHGSALRALCVVPKEIKIQKMRVNAQT